MTEMLIDVWNIKTFDEALLANLYANSDVIRHYMVTSKKNLLEYVTADRWEPLQSNS